MLLFGDWRIDILYWRKVQNRIRERHTVLLRWVFGFLALSSLAACVTPGFDYTARIAPGNPEAATYRTVSVDRFRGPLGDWYAEEFEGMLQSATFEGDPWFQVALFSRQSNVAGVYYGTVEISRPTVDEHYSDYSVCVEKDKETKKCIKKKLIEQVCLRYSVAVRTSPVLIDVNTDEIIHQASYTASDDDQECFETGHVEYRIRRGPNDPGRGKYRFAYEDYNQPGRRPNSGFIIDRITASALRDTIWQARRDIAPYNRETRARILTKAERPDVGGDPRFTEAVASVRSGQYSEACTLFRALDTDYPQAPAILHNLGACSEASGQAAVAQEFYAQAVGSAQQLGTESARRILQALDRISDRRTDEVLLNSIMPPES